MTIRLVTNEDLSDWHELAKEVEPLFGKMAHCEEFMQGIKKTISSDSAFCIIHTNNEIGGIVAVDKSKNEIVWLVVKKESRSKGYGRQLLKAAIDSLDDDQPVYVQTFSVAATEGRAARHLYERFGFIDYKEAGKNPAGIDTVIMRLDSSKEGSTYVLS